MTESSHEERVQKSGVVGHSHDTDDLDIYEALVNPHDGHGAGHKKGGPGGPTMMAMGGTGAGSSTDPSTAAGIGITVPSAGGGPATGTANLGVTAVRASPEMLHKEAQHWDDTAKEFAASVTNPIGTQSPSSVDFGMMKSAFGPYNDLLNRLKKWSTQAGTEFSAISGALQFASGGYSDTEATSTATALRVQTGSSIPE